MRPLKLDPNWPSIQRHNLNYLNTQLISINLLIELFKKFAIKFILKLVCLIHNLLPVSKYFKLRKIISYMNNCICGKWSTNFYCHITVISINLIQHTINIPVNKTRWLILLLNYSLHFSILWNDIVARCQWSSAFVWIVKVRSF